MALTSEQKNHAKELIESGDKLEAVRYLQQTMGIDAAQALLLAEKLEEEIEKHETAEFSELKQKLDEFKQRSRLKQGANVGRIVVQYLWF